jgi:hypothetical protein
MAVALHYFPPPSYNLTFLAKTLSTGVLSGYDYMIGVQKARMLLGTPIWVSQAPSDEDNVWGLDDHGEAQLVLISGSQIRAVFGSPFIVQRVLGFVPFSKSVID